MNVERAYDRWAESYDSMVNKTRDLDLVATAKNLEGMSFHSILEIGCGTGKNTQWLCRKCSRLVAVDFSEAMMASAMRKVASENVEWNIFDISSPWSIQGADFDLITIGCGSSHQDHQ